MTPSQPGGPDRPAALAMWREYTATLPQPPDEEPAVDRFGHGAELTDELLGLVLAGTERATAGLVADFAHEGEPLPRIGGHWVACDRTRAGWLAGHERYFTRTQAARGQAWDDDLEVVFERFRVVWPPEVADRP